LHFSKFPLRDGPFFIQKMCEDKKKKKKRDSMTCFRTSEHDRETTNMFGRGISTTQSNKQLDLKLENAPNESSSNVHTTLILLRERKSMQQIKKK
jgi:hypothetical protein